MNAKRADVTVHIDEALSPDRTAAVCDHLSKVSGVLNVRCAEHKQHLLIVEFNPDSVSSKDILHRVQSQGLHAELLGL